jgi:hypothetical protein
VSFTDVIRGLLIVQEVFVSVLYVFAAWRFFRCRKQLGERAEGRVVGILGMLCLFAVSLREEFVNWGGPLSIIEPLEFGASIGLFWLWWKVLGVVRWRRRRQVQRYPLGST